MPIQDQKKFCLWSDDEKQQTSHSVLQKTYQLQKVVSSGPEKQTSKTKKNSHMRFLYLYEYCDDNNK